jgi:hypothetical protein
VIYEYGETWWNDIYRGKLLIRLTELSGNPTSRVVCKAGRTDEGNYEFCLTKYLSSYFEGFFNMP